MKRIVIVLFVLLTLTPSFVLAQAESKASSVNLGFGLGIDYGGLLGGRLTVVPTKNFALFGDVGYNLIGLGFNAGGTLRITPDKNVCPTLSVMYGYNAVIKIEGAEQYNKTYYGPTISFGLEFKPQKRGFWNIELLLPIRSQDYKDDLDDLKNNPLIEMKSEPLPIGFSVGYHFWL